MTAPLDLTQPVQTRDGRPVRILCTNAKSDDPIVGLILHESGFESPAMWKPNGQWAHTSGDADLINAPQKLRIWATRHRNKHGNEWATAHIDENEYDKHRTLSSCIGGTMVEIDEGDGLAAPE